MVHSTVVKLEVFGQGCDCKSAVRIVRTRSESTSDGIRLRNDAVSKERTIAVGIEMIYVRMRRFAVMEMAMGYVQVAFLLDHRRVRLLRIYARLIIHDPWLAKKLAREELHVETGFADQLRRYRLIQIHCHEEAFSGRFESHSVA